LQEQPFLHVFVHPDRGTEYARAHEWKSGEIEQALHGAILAVGAVQHGENYVYAHASGREC